MAEYLVRVGQVWHYKRRVPVELNNADPRRVVQKSTGKRDQAEALVVARRFNDETERFWETLNDPRSASNQALDRYEAAIKRARSLGYEYRDVQELADGSLEELLTRIEKLERDRLVTSGPAVEALFGGVQKPVIRVSELCERYFAIARDEVRGKSCNQVRKWRAPRIKAANNLLAVIGNKSIAEITRDDALTFREWWEARIEDYGMDPGTANKDIGHLNRMINSISERLRLQLDQPFARLRLRGERHNPRTPFEIDFVRNSIIAPGALDGLNEQARLLVYAMIETGMRPSEIAGLKSERIFLDVDVPYVEIRPDIRQLKSEASERDIPLVGISLAALRCAKQCFGGFPRYQDSSDNLSGLVNKYFENVGLRPTNAHTLYSLRHTFEDRLLAVEPPDRIAIDLMGHASKRPKYGKGGELRQRQKWLKKIMFNLKGSVPSKILAPYIV